MEKDTKIVLSAILLLLFAMGSFSFIDVTNNSDSITGNAKGINRILQKLQNQQTAQPVATPPPTPQQLCDSATQTLANLRKTKDDITYSISVNIRDDYKYKDEVDKQTELCVPLENSWNLCGKSPSCFRKWGIGLNNCKATLKSSQTKYQNHQTAYLNLKNELTRIQSSLDAAQKNQKEVCISVAQQCVPNWQCSNWSPDYCPPSGEVTRSCNDLGGCGVNTGKPLEIQRCSSGYLKTY